MPSKWLALLACTALNSAAATPPANPFNGARLEIAHLSATLCTAAAEAPTPAAKVVLHYTGPVQQVAGPLCYRFAGYNETCWPAAKRWFTPATRLNLAIPGQVPIELLKNYTLLLRLPWQAADEFPLPLIQGRC